jgi:hypothetical protein
LMPGSWPLSMSSCLRRFVNGLVAEAQIRSDLGNGAARGHQVEHLAAKLFGITAAVDQDDRPKRTSAVRADATSCRPPPVRFTRAHND